MVTRFFSLCLLSLLANCAVVTAAEPVEKILFGSCIKQDQPIPILKHMADENADAVIFLGDNIYADTEDMDVMQEKYQRLGENPDFQRLRQGTRTLATWDDHDYGVNDGGADYPQRENAQKLFLDFWKDSKDSPRRKRAGVYDAAVLGPVGQRVQIILLDTRYFRSPLKRSEERRVGGWYMADDDPAKTMLGAEQWAWLEGQLSQPAEIRIIASSIQCVADAAGQETWSNLPHERKRLFSLIKQTSANGVFLISGDRHWSEFSLQADVLPYPLYDFTSSSLNQIHPRGTPTENRYRSNQQTYHRENFGRISIDWTRDNPQLRVEIVDLSGTAQIVQTLHLSDLQIDR